jgi:hypothetical protein
MDNHEKFLDDVRLKLFTGGDADRAMVVEWLAAAEARLTAGGGALTIDIAASVAGKSGTVQVTLDSLSIQSACRRALFELDNPDAFQPSATLTELYLQ